MLNCKNCGTWLPDGTKFCSNCGAPVDVTTYTEEQPKQESVRTKPQKYCKHCGQLIDEDCVVCPICGKQVEELKSAQPSVVVHNTNTNVNTNTVTAAPRGKAKNKWVAFLLCLFGGFLGLHKFYEGKMVMGILYIFTVGLCGVGVIIDLISLLFKPNPYYIS